MQNTLHVTTKVLPGGKIEIVNGEFRVGEAVDVVVRYSSASARHSAVDILNAAPAPRLFKTAEDVNSLLKDERASWDR